MPILESFDGPPIVTPLAIRITNILELLKEIVCAVEFRKANIVQPELPDDIFRTQSRVREERIR